MDGSWTLEPSADFALPKDIETKDIEETPARVETWTPERIAELTRLWEEGVTTAEIGRRIGVTKNAVIGKVHRIGLVPRVVKEAPPPRRNVFDFVGAACMWPIGHPNDADFHFCGCSPLAGKPYCAEHAAVAYIRPKEKPEAA
ncbi:MAG: GcrA family cell cycle regulator [Thiohalocapsa sp.]